MEWWTSRAVAWKLFIDEQLKDRQVQRHTTAGVSKRSPADDRAHLSRTSDMHRRAGASGRAVARRAAAGIAFHRRSRGQDRKPGHRDRLAPGDSGHHAVAARGNTVQGIR